MGTASKTDTTKRQFNFLPKKSLIFLLGYIGEFEIVDDHRSGKIVVNLTGRLNKVTSTATIITKTFFAKCNFA